MAEAKDIKTGDWVMFNRQPFKVKRKEIVTAGTHMHSKSKLIMVSLFGGGEKAQVYGHHDKLDTVDIQHKLGQVISVSGNKCQIMDTKSYEVFDALTTEENPVSEGQSVLFVSYDGKNIIVGEAR